MTLKELMDEVAALGFEEEIEANAALFGAAKRALMRIYTERAVYSVIQIIPNAAKPTLYQKKITHAPGELLVFSLGESTYSFRVSGCGSFCVGDKAYDFNGNSLVFRGFANEGDELTFRGDFLYTVYDLSVYHGVFAASSRDVRLKGEELSFDLSLMTDDFLAFGELPTDGRGRAVRGARFLGSRLYLPEDCEGVVNLSYRRRPKVPTLDSVDEELDLPAECETLLPLLTASYLWLDDDREKAEFYLDAYREQMSILRRYVSPVAGRGYDVMNGWA